MDESQTATGFLVERNDFGPEDELGTLNFIGPQNVVDAAAEVRTGQVFPLQLPLDVPSPGLRHRDVVRHTYLGLGATASAAGDVRDRVAGGSPITRDDRLDTFYPQGSSHWDALAHVRHPDLGYYNRFPDAEVEQGARLGIEAFAQRGLVTRGVLADVERHLRRTGRGYDVSAPFAITLDILLEVLDASGVRLRPGDLLMVRTGWLSHYLAADSEYRTEVAQTLVTPGLAPDPDLVRWLRETRLAAVAADNLCVECFPAPEEQATLQLHLNAIPRLGLWLGELWQLDDLAAASASDGRPTCLVTSAPLNLPGGVGSPAQALAIR